MRTRAVHRPSCCFVDEKRCHAGCYKSSWPALLRQAHASHGRRRLRASSTTIRRGPASAQLPARTCEGAVQQARQALRSFRQQQKQLSPAPAQPLRVIVEVPLPVPSRDVEVITLFDEADWPGGIQQKFRYLKPLIDALLFGYGMEFCGNLGSKADGVGLWRSSDTTVVANAGNPNVAQVERLWRQEVAGRAGHTLLAVNPSWTAAQDVGQIWERGLRARAAELLAPDAWVTVYALRPMRATRSAGTLWRAWPGPWQLYAHPGGDLRELGKCLLEVEACPSDASLKEELESAEESERKKQPQAATFFEKLRSLL